MDALDDFLQSVRAHGKVDSEGAFRWDLKRGLELFQDRQLLHKSEYILRFVAAAVSSEARVLELSKISRGYQLSWDGQPYTWEDLQNLLPSIVGGEPRLSELLVGILAAQTLFPTVTLKTSGGELRLENGSLETKRAEEPIGRTFLVLERGLIQHFVNSVFKGRESKLLAARCHYAPLEWTLPSGWKKPIAQSALAVVRFGEPPSFFSESVLVSEVNLPTSYGRGYLVFDSVEESFLIHQGVSFPTQDPLLMEHLSIVWWNDEFGLDVSRGAIASNEAYESWWSWLQLSIQDQIIKLLEEDPRSELLRPSLKWLLERNAELDDLPAFCWANGCAVTLAELRQLFQRQGYIATSRQLWTKDNGLDPGQVLLVDEWAECGLQVLLPHWLAVDHLRELDTVPRLPNPELYHVRFPAKASIGEIGLNKFRALIQNVYESDGEDTKFYSTPFALSRLSLDESHPGLAIGDGLRVLNYIEGIDEDDRAFHSLSHLIGAVQVCSPNGSKLAPLRKLFVDGWVTTSNPHELLRETGIRELLERVSFALRDGGRENLLDLYKCRNDWKPERFSLGQATSQFLEILLNSNWDGSVELSFNARIGMFYGPLTDLASYAVEGNTPHGFLYTVLSKPSCSAYMALQSLIGDLTPLKKEVRVAVEGQKPNQKLLQSTLKAVVWGLKEDFIVSTDLVLLGLALEEPKVKALLENYEVSREGLAEARDTLGLRGVEQERDLDERLGQALPNNHRALLLGSYGELRLRQGRHSEATIRFAEAVTLDRDHSLSLAAAFSLAGEWDEVCRCCEEYEDHFESETHRLSLMSEALFELGRVEEAESAVEESLKLDPSCAASLWVKGYLLEARLPKEAMALFRRSAELNQHACWVWENIAKLHLQKNEKVEAELAFETFLERAGRDHRPPYDFDERLASAKARLSELKGS